MNSIELECINVALQKDLEQTKRVAREVPILQDKFKEILKKHKNILKVKKQKYIQKIKDLEGKFVAMCEDKMRAIQGQCFILIKNYRWPHKFNWTTVKIYNTW